MYKFLKYPLFICATLIGLSGCLSDDTDVNLSGDDESQESVHLVNGQIFSVNTLEAIEGVEIKLLVNGIDYRIASSSIVKGDIHTDGYFSFNDVPLGQHTLIIEHPSYATVTRNIPFTENDNSQTRQLGKIGLSATIQMDVVVSSENGNIANAVVQAELIYPDYFCVEGTQIQLFGTEDRISAVSNADGIATLQNLSSCGIYRIVVPALDTDNDGTFDYSTAVTDDSYYNVTRNFSGYDSPYYVSGILPQTIPGPLNIYLEETEYDYSVAVINNNYSDNSNYLYLYKDDEAMGNLSAYTLNDSDKVEIRFNYPVNINEQITIAQIDYANSTSYSYKYIDFPVLVELDATETVMTIKPQTGVFPISSILKMGGSVVAKGKEGSNPLTLLNANNGYLISYSDQFEFSAETTYTNSYSSYIDYNFSKPVTGYVVATYINRYGDERIERISVSYSTRFNYNSSTMKTSLQSRDTLSNWEQVSIEITYELEDQDGNVYEGELTLPGQAL